MILQAEDFFVFFQKLKMEKYKEWKEEWKIDTKSCSSEVCEWLADGEKFCEKMLISTVISRLVG